MSRRSPLFYGRAFKAYFSSLCAITNPQHQLLQAAVPGFEAPVTVGYATSNRSAVIRIPAYAKTPKLRRFELRNPDATCNPYFCYAALLMAGLDGVKNQIDPHAMGWGPYDVNLFHLPEEEKSEAFRASYPAGGRLGRPGSRPRFPDCRRRIPRAFHS